MGYFEGAGKNMFLNRLAQQYGLVQEGVASIYGE
jgi:hypothetical protein